MGNAASTTNGDEHGAVHPRSVGVVTPPGNIDVSLAVTDGSQPLGTESQGGFLPEEMYQRRYSDGNSSVASTPRRRTRSGPRMSFTMPRFRLSTGGATPNACPGTQTGTVRYIANAGVFAEDRDKPVTPTASTSQATMDYFKLGQSRATDDSFGGSPDEAVFRLRFFNYNMANSAGYSGIGALQGPGGRGEFADLLRDPFPDGSRVDAVFITLVETRLSIGEWVRDSLLRREVNLPLDAILTMNARREGANKTRSKLRSKLERVAASYNGNLKSMLAFRSGRFFEDIHGGLFGRLTERSVAGVPVPNPKKAFMGRSIVSQGGLKPSVRLCFVSAHFPVSKLAAALEDTTVDQLTGAKVALAQVLRKILKKANKRGVCDGRTVILVQGDLNSRTVLTGTESRDVLLDVLADDVTQAAIQHGLGLPPGRFRELVFFNDAASLPVTYKYREKAPAETAGTLKLGTVVRHAQNTQSPPRPQPQEGTASWATSSHATNCPYRRMMTDIGKGTLADWGLVYKENDFRPFRFPACTDRVIYWALDALGDRLSWEVEPCGYEVNAQQSGSDHRPVAVEALLRVEPRPIRCSTRTLDGVDTAALIDGDTSRESIRMVCADSDDSDADNDPSVDEAPRPSFRAGRPSTYAPPNHPGDASENEFSPSEPDAPEDRFFHVLKV